MLKQLTIKNTILIESAEISFGQGLNVLSGETGSGKSAIMTALSLILGEKSDPGIIRKGSPKAIVEALFDIEKEPKLKKILRDAGLDHDEDEDLIIRREITLDGKSRCFINNQTSPLKFLKLLTLHLGKIVTQHANQWLMCLNKQLDIVDSFGDLQKEVEDFSKSYEKEKELRQLLNELIQNESKRYREIEIYSTELKEIEEANLKNEEDEELFAEYTLLVNGESLAAKVSEMNEIFSGENFSLLDLLKKQKINFLNLIEIDPKLKELQESFQNAFIELQEIAYTLDTYQSKIESNPKRVQNINDRLTLISKLKKKYGTSIKEIESYKEHAEKKLNDLANEEFRIEELQVKIKELKEKNDKLATSISSKRRKTAKKLEVAMINELTSLNMPKVIFEIIFSPEKRGSKGDESLEFYLIPNIGEHKISIRDCASGGELSRILLSLQRLIGSKEETPTLIFDEIDANIGGETALIVGEKLKEIGKETQVLCITHFPQVAKQADFHFQIYKQEENGRTLTHVKPLHEKENRLVEIARMVGEKSLVSL